MSIGCFCEGRREIEMDLVTAYRTADLRVDRAQVAVLVMRQRPVLRSLCQRVRDAVCKRALLDKQQGADEEQRQEQVRRSHDGATLTKVRWRGKYNRLRKV